MIQQITLNHWKSFQEATLHIEPLTILIGSSASGKSNFIEALSLLSRLSNGRNVREAFTGNSLQDTIRGTPGRITRKPSDQCAIETIIRIPDTNTRYRYHLTIEPATYLVVSEQLTSISSDNDPEQEQIIVNMNIDQENYAPAEVSHGKGIAARIDRMIGLSGLYTNVCRLAEKFPTDVQPVVFSLQHICTLDPIPSLMRYPAKLTDKLCSKGANTASVIARYPAEQQQKLESAISAYAARLPEGNIRRVFAKKVGKLHNEAMLYAKEQWQIDAQPALIDARTMSDGTLRSIAILTLLLTAEEGSLIVVENVDHGALPSQAALFIQLMREIGEERHLSIVITIHNSEILEELGSELTKNVHFVYRDLSTGESKINVPEGK